ncbi:YdeI/OmpD-associated family protein [Telluribacter sp. SYSU D00476]|uniref:YdeI/OmpD-associated family protein n=1 Tax=Telluribacter sp. SYSU D00476 TaxID=2811430 RepID=UPI001FF463A4|nr:YdeI/OmpD-associated family protein [Telluribacter sp. SYSU D00476]
MSSPTTFTTRIHSLDYLLGMTYLEIPPDVVQQLGGSFSMRLICTVNNALDWQCGLVALGQGAAYISISAKRMKALRVRLGDEVLVSLVKDESEYGVPVPEELQELFGQDPEGFQRFKQLAPGKQRYIINYVATVKNSQLRVDRAIQLIENLKRLPAGRESFRAILGK